MNKEKLQKLGLSAKEASVYLAMLELGPTVVSDIAKKAGVNRSTVYVVLDFLTKRGLVNESDSKTAKLYSPMPPEKLVDHFEELAKQYKELAGSAKVMLPELKSLRKIKKEVEIKPKINLVEGQKGIQTVYEDTLGSLEAIRAYASLGDEQEANKNIKAKIILPTNQKNRDQIAQNKGETWEALLASRGKYSFAPEINIYDKKVVFISPAEGFALVVESKQLAKALKNAFDLAEKESARMNKKVIVTKLSPKALPG